MKSPFFAAFALAPLTPLHAQAPASVSTQNLDYSTATPIGGTWSYASTDGGSEAAFTGPTGQPQITIRCTRAVRRVSIAKAATGAAPSISIWTTAGTKTALASYNPATARLTVEFAAFDPTLDAIAFSRGRVVFSAAGAPALVVPTWAETARVIEDCRV